MIDIEEEVLNNKYNIKFKNIVINYLIKNENNIIFYNYNKTV